MRSKLILIALLAVFVFTAYFFINNHVKILTEEKYYENAISIRQKIETLIQAKKEAILYVSMALADNSLLQKALQESDYTLLNLKQFAARFQTASPLHNIWFQVIDTEGKSFYRSWTDKRGDDMLPARMDIARMLKRPRIMTTVSTGKYDMTFKAMVPIYDRDKFLGIFESISNFDSIANKIQQEHWQTAILVDRKYRGQLIYPATKTFIEDYYVANAEADTAILQDIKAKGVDFFIRSKKRYHVDLQKNRLIVRYILNDVRGDPMGYILLSKPLSMIDMSATRHIQKDLYLYALLLIAVSYLSIQYLLIWRKNRLFGEFNAKLKARVEKKTREIQEKSTFLQTILDGVSDSVMVINSDYSISLMNRVAKRAWHNKYIEDPENPKCYEISHHRSTPCDGQEHPCPLKLAMDFKKSNTVIHQHHTAQGDEVYVELTAIPMTDKDGNVTSIIELGHDITSHINAQNELEKQKDTLHHQAHHDALTQLPNRLLFLDRLRQTISYCERSGKRAAVVFIDLDRFKAINDSLGHSAGDSVLLETAHRLQQSIRTSDTVARLSGDEFTMIINIHHSDQEVIRVLERITQLLNKSLVIKNNKLQIEVSIGISIYPDNGTTPEMLLKNADTAMYKAKKAGQKNYAFYVQ